MIKVGEYPQFIWASWDSIKLQLFPEELLFVFYLMHSSSLSHLYFFDRHKIEIPSLEIIIDGLIPFHTF